MADGVEGKKVVVTKNDGVKKYGTVKAVSDVFLTLQFDDGRVEIIPLMQISRICEDTR